MPDNQLLYNLLWHKSQVIRCLILAHSKRSLKIKIVEDDEDSLTLYSDYLVNRGYRVIGLYRGANEVQNDLEGESPDIYLINSKLPGNKNGAEVATEILNLYPSTPILFITADSNQPEKIQKNPSFQNKKVDILMKPARLMEIEHSILNLMNK